MSRKQIFIAIGVVALIALSVIGYFALRPSADRSAAPAGPSANAGAQQSQPSGEAPQPMIVVIDRAAIMQYSKVGQDVSRQVQAFSDQAKKDLAGQRQALENDDRQLQQQASTLAPDVRQKRIAALEAKQAAFQQIVQRKSMQITNAIAQARSAVEKTMGPILEQIVKERGANMVLDKQAVTFANTSAFDITSDVIEQLDAKMPSYKVTLAPATK